MRVEKAQEGAGTGSFLRLLDDKGRAVEEVDGFLRYLAARGDSPNTLEAYAYDLLRFHRFLEERGLGYGDFTPAVSLAYLEHLRGARSQNRAARRLSPVLVADGEGADASSVGAPGGRPATRLSPASVNRAIACVSSFFEFLILSERVAGVSNSILQRPDHTLARVPDRPKPFLHGIARRENRPRSKVARVKTALRVPRPLPDGHFEALLESLGKLRDKAMLLLMEQGGLMPGEVLCLKLEDVQYGRRRVVVRHRQDHPKGARTKSRTERVVDLHEPEALATLSAYVMRERPRDADSPFIFLVGGGGERRLEPLSYSALVRTFARRCEALGIREPWVTPHALRHRHATRMWEGGMRELALQKRLGHASPESTRLYTRLSDQAVIAEYRRALGGADGPPA